MKQKINSISTEISMNWDDITDPDGGFYSEYTDSVSDALLLSITKFAQVDIEYISSITGKDFDTVISALQGAIYQNPETWDECRHKGWETAEEYLSGNLLRKLNIAKDANDQYSGYFQNNVDILEKFLPSSVAAKDIYISLGSPWIPTDIINAFATHILSIDTTKYIGYRHTIHDEYTGAWELPDNCIVIAAGNRTTDKSVIYKMPKALANRLLHIEISTDFDSWKKWAISNGINDKVIGFLSFRQDYFMTFDAANEDLSFATPRSWEMVSNILNHVNNDINSAFLLISGLVGSGIAIEFRAWDKIYSQLPNIEDIFKGKMPPFPKNTDVLYAITSAMTSYAREHKDEMSLIANSIRYATMMPADFSTIVLKDYMSIEPNYKNKLMMIPEFKKWISTKGKLLNGVV